MDHFAIVLAILRSAMKSPTEALRANANRLLQALRKDGLPDQVAALERLLEGEQSLGKFEPSRVVLSLAALPGEQLTPSVKVPVDKETSAPLAEVLSGNWSDELHAPVLTADLRLSIDAAMNEWRNIEKLRAVGIRPPLNCLLFGAPGTGKTRLAHVIAREVALPVVTARLDGLISSFLGTTARNISALFAFANRYRCVLLLDEFDAIAKVRDDQHEVGEVKRVVNTLLQCLDSRSAVGITIAVTNHEHLLDTAIWRRFDLRICVPKPDFPSRVEIISRYVYPLSVTDTERRFLAWITDGLTGADIETLANAIKRSAALSPSGDFSIFGATKNFALLNASHRPMPKWQRLGGALEHVVDALVEDSELSFTQEELAALLGKDQSTISRWKRRKRAHVESV